MGTCQSVTNSNFKRPNSSSSPSHHTPTSSNNSFIKTKFTKLRRSLRKSLREKSEDIDEYYNDRIDSESDEARTVNESASPVNNSQRDIQYTTSLPVVKVKLVEFLEFQEFNTFVETVQIKPNQNETYILKNSTSIDEPVYQRPANKSARATRMSNILNEINTNLPEQKMNPNVNKVGVASPSSFSTGIPVTNRFGFKHIATAKPTSISLPKTSDRRPEKSLPVENEIEVSTSSPNTTSTASPASSISSTSSSYNRYSMTKQSLIKKPGSYNRPLSNSSNPTKINIASSSLSSLSSVSNSSSNLSSNNQIDNNSVKQRSIKSSSATLKINMENSNITRLPVRKDVNSQSSDSFTRPPATTTTSSHHQSQHRKHSFTPYNLTSHNDQTQASSKVVDTSNVKETTSPSKSKLLRFNSPKVSSSRLVNTTSSNNQSLIARRADSAYCSSTSSTSSSTANDNEKKTSDLNNNDLIDESKPLDNEPTDIDLLLNEKAPFEVEDSEEHAIYDKTPDTTSGSSLNKASIRDSICELNQLMMISSSSIGSQHNTQTNMEQKPEQSSATPLHFKMPSNLPAPSVEDGGELIQIDIETYRLLVQDLQDCKLILHKLASLMRDQPGGGLNEEEFALELNKLKLTSEQSTQTE